jgi:hypothetical protein
LPSQYPGRFAGRAALAVTMQNGVNAKTRRRNGTGSGGEIDSLIRASPFGEPDWHGQNPLCSAIMQSHSFARRFGKGMGRSVCRFFLPRMLFPRKHSGFGVPRPPRAYSEDKMAGRKMGAKKSPAFMFLPPFFCLSLCVWPAVPGDLFYPWNPCHPWSHSFGCGLPRCAFALRPSCLIEWIRFGGTIAAALKIVHILCCSPI